MKKRTIADIVVKYLVIVAGALLFAIGFQLFAYPNNIISGGVTGIAMIINKLIGMPVGVLSIILNIPLFILAWKNFGWKFIFDSLIGTLLASVFVDLVATLNIVATTDSLLACIVGGSLKGLGLGLIYWEGATTGGSDILAKLMRKHYPYINFGTMVLVMDCVIIVAFTLIFKDYQGAMYGVVTMFVVSKIIDLVLYGAETAYLFYIVSDKSEEVSKLITEELNRGVTILHGQGAYTGDEKQVLMCVVKRSQSVEVRKIVKGVDPKAFLIVSEAKNVFGHGFGDISNIS